MNHYEKLSVAGTAVAPVGGAGQSYTGPAVIRCEGANIRWRDDGTNPTATDGFLLQNGEELHIDGLANFKAIRTTSTSATLHIAYY